jgi:hypothetical protein
MKFRILTVIAQHYHLTFIVFQNSEQMGQPSNVGVSLYVKAELCPSVSAFRKRPRRYPTPFEDHQR